MLVTDVGWNKNGVAQCYQLPAEGRFITPGGASTMGFGRPPRWASRSPIPNGSWCALVGDGGMSAQWPALPMAVEQGLPVIFVVMNNRAHGTIADLQAASFGSSYGCEFRDPDGRPYSPDFAALARACGADGYSIAAPADLADGAACVERRRPAVLDVPMINEPVPTPGHWNITDIYRGVFDLPHLSVIAVDGVSLSVRSRRDPRRGRAERVGQDHAVQRDQRPLPAQVRPGASCSMAGSSPGPGPSGSRGSGWHGRSSTCGCSSQLSVRENLLVALDRTRLVVELAVRSAGHSGCGGTSGRCGCGPSELWTSFGLAAVRRFRPGALPYGIQRRLELARAMAGAAAAAAGQPAAGLNGEEGSGSRAGIVRSIRDSRVTVVPDRAQHGPGHVAVLAGGRAGQRDRDRRGAPAEVARDPAVLEAYLGKSAVPEWTEAPS